MGDFCGKRPGNFPSTGIGKRIFALGRKVFGLHLTEIWPPEVVLGRRKWRCKSEISPKIRPKIAPKTGKRIVTGRLYRLGTVSFKLIYLYIWQRPYCYPQRCIGRYDNGCGHVLTRHCLDQECVSPANNYEANGADTSLVHWLNDTAGDQIDMVVGNKELLHYQKDTDHLNDKLCKSYLLKHPLKDAQQLIQMFYNNKHY